MRLMPVNRILGLLHFLGSGDNHTRFNAHWPEFGLVPFSTPISSGMTRKVRVRCGKLDLFYFQRTLGWFLGVVRKLFKEINSNRSFV